MNILDALFLAKTHGRRVRPASWGARRPGCWVEARAAGEGVVVFVALGRSPGGPRGLNLRHDHELLGPWEEMEEKAGAP